MAVASVNRLHQRPANQGCPGKAAAVPGEGLAPWQPPHQPGGQAQRKDK